MPSATAIPMLICRDANAEIAFCTRAFAATELSRRVAPDGRVLHATLKIGATMLMVHSEVAHLASRAPEADGSSSVVMYLVIDDADATFTRAVSEGARVLLPLKNEPWGYRVGRVMDRSGHVWNIAAQLKDEWEHASRS